MGNEFEVEGAENPTSIASSDNEVNEQPARKMTAEHESNSLTSGPARPKEKNVRKSRIRMGSIKQHDIARIEMPITLEGLIIPGPIAETLDLSPPLNTKGGIIQDDGYEYIEWPHSSDSWWYRIPHNGDAWKRYDDNEMEKSDDESEGFGGIKIEDISDDSMSNNSFDRDNNPYYQEARIPGVGGCIFT